MCTSRQHDIRTAVRPLEAPPSLAPISPKALPGPLTVSSHTGPPRPWSAVWHADSDIPSRATVLKSSSRYVTNFCVIFTDTGDSVWTATSEIPDRATFLALTNRAVTERWDVLTYLGGAIFTFDAVRNLQ